MNVLVCVKQVPDTAEIRMDPETNTLIRKGVPSILNPFDGYALEAAARLKDKDPGLKIVAISMGPEQAKAALKDCLAMAADKAYLISGRVFGGSDTLATSYILSEAVKKIEELEGRIDAVFCGKQAIDGDTAQVGPEIAEHLGWPQVTRALKAEAKGDCLTVKKETDWGAQIISLKMPCLITFTKPAWDPRLPTLKRKMAANRAEIPVLSDDDLPGLDPGRAGLSGSPTKVTKTFAVPRKTGGVVITEESAAAAAQKLAALLDRAGVI